MPRKTGRKKKGRAARKAAGGGSGGGRRQKNGSAAAAEKVDSAVATTGADEQQKENSVANAHGGEQLRNDDSSGQDVASKPSAEGEDTKGGYEEKGYLPNMDRISNQLDRTSGDDGKYLKDGQITAEYVQDLQEAFLKDFESMRIAGVFGKRSDEEERAAERHEAVLFGGHPRQEDCPVCFLPLPVAANQRSYKVCCGKILCDGCIYALRERGSFGIDVCPFCRVSIRHDDTIDFILKRASLNDPNALMILSTIHRDGKYGLEKDAEKALELLVKAVELECPEAQASLGHKYLHGVDVEKDMWKASHYLERGAKNGSVEARYVLGGWMGSLGGTATGCDRENRAIDHLMIAAKAGYKPSLECLKKAYSDGHATKDAYEQSLRGYHESVKELRSEQRDRAAAWYARNPRAGG